MLPVAKRYRSFISYSQKDKVWGRRLQQWLETYRVPVGVIADVQSGQRLGRFFRDEAEMPAASDIGNVVRDAIEKAESLIVVCSPHSAQSVWVASEITHFRRLNPGADIFAVIVAGVPNSGDPETECFPPALRRGGGDQEMPIEPVGVDVRVDSKARICARLAAGLLGVNFDDLWQRDRRRAEGQQRRAIITLAALSTTFALLAGAAVWSAVIARQQSHRAEAAHLALQNEYLAILGESGIEQVLASGLVPGVIEGRPPDGWITLMQSGGQDFLIARQHGKGRILAVAHDGLLDAAWFPKGDAFLRRAIGWLRGPEGPSDVAITDGHCEFMTLAVDDWVLPGFLVSWGSSVVDLPGRVDDEALSGVGVLIVGNAWSTFEPEEIAAIERFVLEGGGLFLAGLGWSWVESASDPAAACATAPPMLEPATLQNYPMNVLGARFGARWLEGAAE